MKTNGGVEAQLHAVLSLKTDEIEWSPTYFSCFTLGEK
jgi:hypothetical protein